MIYTVSNGSGGSPNVLIKTETGATVTLSKGDVVLTKVAENGEALFENVEYGTWTAQASLNGQTSDSVSIEVKQEIESEVSFGIPASELQVGDKVKIGGTKYVVKAIGHEGYPTSSITLVQEKITSSSSFGATVFAVDWTSSTLKAYCEQTYNQLSQAEKNAIVQTTRKIKNGAGQYPEFTEHIFVLNSQEVGRNADTQMGSNLGFTSPSDRICYNEDGTATHYWLSDAYSSTNVWAVDNSGTIYYFDATNSYGIRMALNLSPTAPIAPMDSTGYYTIQGADTVSELKDKSLEILGVKL